MSSSKPIQILELHHFNEPWCVTHDELGPAVYTAKDELIADCIVLTVPNEHADFYLQRIAACVNACVGLTNSDLERLKPGELAGLYLDERAKKAAGR